MGRAHGLRVVIKAREDMLKQHGLSDDTVASEKLGATKFTIFVFTFDFLVWPERFRICKGKKASSQPTFSLEGLTECWMPHGGG
ncbi:hypothetical protein LY76DRAFT_588317 [Colletotrichum caudatum]|nr:hypothetical protein LY76DRAFT_588317 [Colletotrichum caudatum]